MNRRGTESKRNIGLKNASKKILSDDNSTQLASKGNIRDRRKTRTSRKFGSDITNIVNIPEAMDIQSQQKPYASELQEVTTAQFQNKENDIFPYIPQIKNHMAFVDTKYNSSVLDWIKQATNKEITPQMRNILVKWIIQVGQKFRVKPETIHICIQIIDYVLIVKGNNINKSNYQLLGITSLFVASKYNQIQVHQSDRYVYVCDGQYTLQQLFDMESLILIATDFNLQIPTVIQFAQGLAQESSLPQKCIDLVKNLSNLCVFDFNLLNKYKKNDLASVVVYLASKIHGLENIKSKDLIEQIGVQTETFKECLMSLINIYKQNKKDENQIKI